MSPAEDAFVAGFIISAHERADLIAFPESLTDESFLIDSRFSDPLRGAG